MSIVHDTDAQSFYEAISELNTNAENRMLTVIDGEHAGEKAVISGGDFSWASDENGFLAAHADEVKGISGSGLTDICGTAVFSELLGSGREMIICGGGHVAMQILKISKMLGFCTTVIEDRLKFANDAIEQGADKVIFKAFDEALSEIEGSDDSFFVIVTRGHRYDKECLRSIVTKPHAYIGMMGSRRRVAIVKDDLEKEGIPRGLLDSVHTPIGLDIGAETPEEIAVSVMAEIIDVKSRLKRSGGFDQDVTDALMAEGRDKMVMATIISRQGSAPRSIGTKMLIAKDGGITGTIGGGCIEGSVIAKGRRMLLDEDHRPAVVEVDMSRDTAEDEGMVCGGRVRVFLEVV